MADAGYSGTPLPKKLGLKDGQRALFVALPDTLRFLSAAAEFEFVAAGDWADLPRNRPLNYCHVFCKSRAELEEHAQALFESIKPAGMIWLSWPKRASTVPTDITEHVLREIFLPTGLVDVKVCAVDEVWSGLKFMIRTELRASL